MAALLAAAAPSPAELADIGSKIKILDRIAQDVGGTEAAEHVLCRVVAVTQAALAHAHSQKDSASRIQAFEQHLYDWYRDQHDIAPWETDALITMLLLNGLNDVALLTWTEQILDGLTADGRDYTRELKPKAVDEWERMRWAFSHRMTAVYRPLPLWSF